MQTVFVDHAAEILGVSRRTVYYWIRGRKLQTVRTPNGTQRVRVESIEVLLRELLEARVQRSARRSVARARRVDEAAH